VLGIEEHPGPAIYRLATEALALGAHDAKQLPRPNGQNNSLFLDIRPRRDQICVGGDLAYDGANHQSAFVAPVPLRWSR
jgi:hypothetical protein